MGMFVPKEKSKEQSQEEAKMLLRSSSSPMLKSLISISADTSPISANHLPHCGPSLIPRATMLTRAVSESNISDLLPPVPKRKQCAIIIENVEEEKEVITIHKSSSLGVRLLSCSGLEAPVAPSPSPSLMVMAGCSDKLAVNDGCFGDGGSGGKICGGGGGGGGGGGSDSNLGADAYYQKMIDANPSDPLILGNYAKYLKEVRGDLGKAEEYCERAILANEGDGNVLAMYADIIWEGSKDAERAETYFDRAVQAAPEDCYVMASYARFLWDAEEEEEDEDGAEQGVNSWTHPPFFQAASVS